MKKVILQSTIVLSALLVSACGDKQVTRNVTAEPAAPAAENSSGGSDNNSNNSANTPDVTAPTLTFTLPAPTQNLNSVNRNIYGWIDSASRLLPLEFNVDASNVNNYSISVICGEAGAQVSAVVEGVSNYRLDQQAVCDESKLLQFNFDFYTTSKQFRQGELRITLTITDALGNKSTYQKVGLMMTQITLVRLDSDLKLYYLNAESSNVVLRGSCTSYAGDINVTFLGSTQILPCGSDNRFLLSYNLSSQSVGLYPYIISQPELVADVESRITGNIEKLTDSVVTEIVIRNASDLARFAPMAVSARIANSFTLPVDFPYGLVLRAKIDGTNKNIFGVNKTVSNGAANLFSGIEFGGVLKNIQIFVTRLEGLEQVALIGTNNGLLRNVGVWPTDVNSKIVGAAYVGSLVAINSYTGRILDSGAHMTFLIKNNSSVGMSFSDLGSERLNVAGGLVGYNLGLIEASAAYPTMQGEVVSGRVTGDGLGGVAGVNIGKISKVFAKGTISGDDFIGGIVGRIVSASSNIYNVKAEMTLTGDDYMGGIIGDTLNGILKQALSVSRLNLNLGDGSGSDHVGGVVGNAGSGALRIEYNDIGGISFRSFESIYFDSTLSGISTDLLGVGKTSVELSDQSAYVGFDFNAPVWEMSNGYAQQSSTTGVDPFGH